MSYYHSLAFYLRLRRVPESKIAEILHDVRELSQQSGEDPAQQFGPAATYAQQVPAGRVRSGATRIAIAIFTIGLAVLVVDLLLRSFGDTHLAIGPVPLALIVIALDIPIVACVIALEHRLPSGFRIMPERSN
jgi:hypothetical protein